MSAKSNFNNSNVDSIRSRSACFERGIERHVSVGRVRSRGVDDVVEHVVIPSPMAQSNAVRGHATAADASLARRPRASSSDATARAEKAGAKSFSLDV